MVVVALVGAREDSTPLRNQNNGSSRRRAVILSVDGIAGIELLGFQGSSDV